MKSFVKLATEALKTWQIILEIKKRRMVLEEQEKIEDEIRKLEKEINKLRGTGHPDAANLLLKREARRARLRVWLDSHEDG